MSDSSSYNDFGEIATYSADFGSSSYSVTYDELTAPRDKLGRITRKTETIGGVTAVHEYSYDEAGLASANVSDDLQ